MNTKLTLRMDKALIERAKHYAAQRGKSVSRIVADLFAALEKETPQDMASLTPTVDSIKGVLKNRTVSEGDYKNCLKEKHL